MSDQITVTRARLVEIDLTGDGDTHPEVGRPYEVQFNPESLRVAHSNSAGETDITGTAGLQYMASSSLKLDVELWFDATVQGQTDVRQLTGPVKNLAKAKSITDEGKAKFVIPAVRFTWGNFLFEGVIMSLNETLEFFDNEGNALRSKITLNLSSQDIRFQIQQLENAQQQGPGQVPQSPVADGDSVQQLAGGSGSSAGWQSLAEANNIDDPRNPGAGTLLSNPSGRRP